MRSWPFGRNISLSNKLCCLSIGTHEATLVYSSQASKNAEIDLFKTFTFAKSSGLKATLSSVVNQFDLNNARCTWLLDSNHYQLFLMEDLPVEPGEFQAAIRWKIKSLLSFPVEDAVIDSFPVPVQKTFRPQKMIMVIVSRASYLQPIVEQIQQSGLDLQVIDILELTLRNIAASIYPGEVSSALLYLKKQTGHLVITRNNELYLARQIDFDEISAEDTHSLETLALEIQRSFDYFQSQWRISAPQNVLFASSRPTKIDLTSGLANYLAIPVNACDVNKIIENKARLTEEQQSRYLPLIGALLRDEVNEHASTD